MLPQPLVAFRNAFLLRESARTPVAGMAELYADVVAAHPDVFVVYLSTGAWNTAGAMARFLHHHGFPRGSAAPHRLGAHHQRLVPLRAPSTSAPSSAGCSRSSPTWTGCWSVTTASTTRPSTPSWRRPPRTASSASRSASSASASRSSATGRRSPATSPPARRGRGGPGPRRVRPARRAAGARPPGSSGSGKAVSARERGCTRLPARSLERPLRCWGGSAGGARSRPPPSGAPPMTSAPRHRSAVASPSPGRSPPPPSSARPAAAAAADDDLAAYPPARFKGKDKLLSRNDRHLVSRFSYGVTPDLARDVRKAGGAQAWFEQQLQAELGQGQQGRPAPGLVAEPQARPRASSGSARTQGVEGGWEVMNDYARWSHDAPDGLEPPGLRGHGGVLGEPPARPGARRRPVHAPGRLRQPDPRARPGPVRRDAARPPRRTPRC